MTVVSPEAPPARRRTKRLVTILASLLALALIAGGGYLWYARQHALNNVKQENLMPSVVAQKLVVPQDAQGNLIDNDKAAVVDDQGQPIDATTLHVNGRDEVADARERVMLSLNGTALPRSSDSQQGTVIVGVPSTAIAQPGKADTAGNSLNFLVIGQDKASGGVSRSDVMVIAHISSDRKRVDLIHVPRDLYVSIPGQGKNKINAAYAFGGAPLLVQTLQPLLGVPIDHVVRVDFDGFKAITDSLGGVWLPVDGQRVRMNGTQALSWVRERKTLSQGDISRGQRQMQFIRAVMMEYLGHGELKDPAQVKKLIDSTSDNLVIDQNLSPDDLQKLATSLGDVNGANLKMWTAPWISAGPGPHGMAIVTMSEPQMAKLSQALKTDSMATYTDDVSPKSGFGG